MIRALNKFEAFKPSPSQRKQINVPPILKQEMHLDAEIIKHTLRNKKHQFSTLVDEQADKILASKHRGSNKLPAVNVSAMKERPSQGFDKQSPLVSRYASMGAMHNEKEVNNLYPNDSEIISRMEELSGIQNAAQSFYGINNNKLSQPKNIQLNNSDFAKTTHNFSFKRKTVHLSKGKPEE